jgi:hypothetical protein
MKGNYEYFYPRKIWFKGTLRDGDRVQKGTGDHPGYLPKAKDVCYLSGADIS